jgi:hypothetical protein
MARPAQVRRPVTADDPRVACDTLIRDDGKMFAVLASHAAEPLAVKPAVSTGGGLIFDPAVRQPAGSRVSPRQAPRRSPT